MTRVLFICHGNICRSPMAEFLFKDMVKKAGLQNDFLIESAATSYEEIGNPVHPGTKRKLAEQGISAKGKRARKLLGSDYDKYDLFIGMDSANIRNINRIFGGDPKGKVKKMLEFAGSYDDVADPWYTGNFEVTYDDIMRGLKGLFKELTGKEYRARQR